MAEELQITDYDFELPPELIAQEPSHRRDEARLLVLDRALGALAHHRVADLPEFLRPGDLVVLNDTKVVRARLFGRRAKTGGKWEGLFLRRQGTVWEMLAHTRGYLRDDEEIIVPARSGSYQPDFRLRVVGRTPERHLLVTPAEPCDPFDILEHYGHVPLPPYIRKGLDTAADHERYQTVFAREPGSVAAPTAGLHFTPDLFDRLRAKGVESAFVTLHVGAGTFAPLGLDQIQSGRLHQEYCAVSAAAAAALAACRARGGRIVAVGTTTVRTLESFARAQAAAPWSGTTDLFIRPPFEFRSTDGLLTNFHLPCSSLLMLVAAFATRPMVLEAYRAAVALRYRFFSYGDAMLVL
jgi:S-adenosylmethionine:tRNA ribosyltransferase-isomerase